MLAVRSDEARGSRLGTMLALHGLMESAEGLRAMTQRWARVGWRVLAPDLRGHGRSPRWEPAQLDDRSGDLMVDDVARIPLAMHPGEPLVVFGHSAGGSVAAGLLERDLPITALVLEDPFWRLPVEFRQDPDVAAHAAARLRAWQGLDTSALATRADPRWRRAEAMLWARAKLATDPAIVAHGTVIPRTPWPDLLAVAVQRGVRVHVVTGTERTGITAAHQDIVRAHGGSVTTIEGASHFVRRTAEAAFDADIDSLLASFGRAAA